MKFQYRYLHFPLSTALKTALDDTLRRQLGERQYLLACVELDTTYWHTCGNDAVVFKALKLFAKKYGIEVPA